MTRKLTFSHPSLPVRTVIRFLCNAILMQRVCAWVSVKFHIQSTLNWWTGRAIERKISWQLSMQITWTRLKRKSKKQLRRRNTGQSCQERNQHNFVPRVSNHFGRRETLETRLKSETRERARSSSTSSLGFSLLPRGKREREPCTTTFVCLYCLSFAAWFTVEHLLFSLSFC